MYVSTHRCSLYIYIYIPTARAYGANIVEPLLKMQYISSMLDLYHSSFIINILITAPVFFSSSSFLDNYTGGCEGDGCGAGCIGDECART